MRSSNSRRKRRMSRNDVRIRTVVTSVSVKLVESVFFFQAEDGIRDYKVTGVQTCALPILGARAGEYVPDMYGSNTGSALHGTIPTDRFIAEWDLRGATPISHQARAGAAPSDRKSVV